MTLAVLGHQPYSEVAAMSWREQDTLYAVIKDVNEAEGGGKRGRRSPRSRRP